MVSLAQTPGQGLPIELGTVFFFFFFMQIIKLWILHVQEAKQAGERHCVQISLVQLQLIQQKLKTI
jgi:hypothetical protein